MINPKNFESLEAMRAWLRGDAQHEEEQPNDGGNSLGITGVHFDFDDIDNEEEFSICERTFVEISKGMRTARSVDDGKIRAAKPLVVKLEPKFNDAESGTMNQIFKEVAEGREMTSIVSKQLSFALADAMKDWHQDRLVRIFGRKIERMNVQVTAAPGYGTVEIEFFGEAENAKRK